MYSCFAITAPGLEPFTAGELERLGLAPLEVEPGGVSFPADMAQLCRANLRLRTVSRVVVRLGAFHARSFIELERHAARLPWRTVLPGGAPAGFHVSSRKSRLYHQRAIAERLERIAGAGQGAEGEPTLFVVRVFRDEVTVSVDSSGELLHRRGYRLEAGKAPVRETLAAALLLASGWNGAAPLVDPFAGSGTIPIEAALLATNTAPGLARQFGFERWAGFDPLAGETERSRALGERRTAPAPIIAADRDAGVVGAARANATRAGVEDAIEFRRASISDLDPPAGPGWIVTNPPWGIRVGDESRLRNLYARFGAVLRERCAGWQVAMLSASPALERATGLGFEPLAVTTNGGVKVRLVRATC